MVDLARRKDVLVDVSENVRADYRGGLLFHEGIIISLQRVLVEIHVVGVELHDETAATRVVGAKVPAAANAKVATWGHDVDNTLVGLSHLRHGLCRAVSGMALWSILYDEDIVFEACLLCQRAIHGVANGTYAVTHRYHDAYLDRELACHDVDGSELRLEVSANFLQILCHCLLHLYL